jgi:hypothetical protein
MSTLRLLAIFKRAASGYTLRKLLFSLSAVLLVFAPPVAHADGASGGHDYQFCNGYFALCAASTCKPTGKHIKVNVTGGGTAIFPEVDCTCPIFSGPALADVTGGNMQGSCEPPGPGQIWSLYSFKTHIPQKINDWVPTGPEAASPPQVCPKSLGVGNQISNCFSLACDSLTYINGVPVATCHCPMGESFAGTPVAPQTAFATQAGQGNKEFCSQHPVSVPISLQ